MMKYLHRVEAAAQVVRLQYEEPMGTHGLLTAAVRNLIAALEARPAAPEDTP